MVSKSTLIGAHVSTGGGLFSAIDRAEEIGANIIQIFGSSPRTWRAKMPSESDVLKFKERIEGSSIKKVYLHATYLVNLGSASDDIYTYSRQSLIDHLTIGEMIGAEGLIFHIGSSKGISKVEAIQKEVDAVHYILDRVPGKISLCMENTAGGGEKIGETFEEMADLFNRAKSERVQLCFDTAHAFEAGWFSEYTPTTVKQFFKMWDKEIGLENLSVLHVNDSKTAHSSHHDRHENIGTGEIGIKGFQALRNEQMLSGIPWILEVPGFLGEGPDKKNIDIVKSL